MQILEHGQAQERTLLFFPCTAEPVWAFADTITLLSQRWHVFQVVYDGHQPEYPGDFTSVEQTVDEVISYLKSHGVSRLGGAYGCSMGGACLTRMLALEEMPIDQAIIDGGITPYQLPFLVRKLLLARDVLSFKMAANSRKVLEAAFPPERFTPAGHDPKKEYDAMEAYLKTFSDRTIRNVFWSANNYALPKRSAKIGAKITYWYGDDEKKDRRRDIRFIKRYFPKARIHGIPKMAHAELVMVHPEKFCRYAEKFLTIFYQSEDENSGQFTYFAFSPDTMETTYHLEFRYAEDLSDLQSWFEGNYAYWNAAAIAEDYDQATMKNVIELFTTENLSAAE